MEINPTKEQLYRMRGLIREGLIWFSPFDHELHGSGKFLNDDDRDFVADNQDLAIDLASRKYKECPEDKRYILRRDGVFVAFGDSPDILKVKAMGLYGIKDNRYDFKNNGLEISKNTEYLPILSKDEKAFLVRKIKSYINKGVSFYYDNNNCCQIKLNSKCEKLTEKEVDDIHDICLYRHEIAVNESDKMAKT